MKTISTSLLLSLVVFFISCNQLGITPSNNKKKSNTDPATLNALLRQAPPPMMQQAKGIKPFDCVNCTCSTSISTTGGPSCQTCFSSEIPSWIKDNFTCVNAYKSGTNYVINTNGVPPHKSYYYGTSSSYFEAMPSGRTGNPNSIQVQSVTFTIPVTPTYSASPAATGLGPVGVATNGVLIFNNEAGPGDSLTTEYVSMDAAEAHPQQQGQYHYHVEPVKITNNDAKLIGVLADGYPVYGKKAEDGSYPTLDAYGTRACTTTLFPNGTYCYHVRNASGVNGYIVSHYRGTKGSISF